MANMSYCRFHNTRMDMEDCIDALRDAEQGIEEISDSEINSCKRMFNNIMEYLDKQGILDGIDWDAYEEWKSNLDEWGEK